jgi:hypothetical protein
MSADLNMSVRILVPQSKLAFFALFRARELRECVGQSKKLLDSARNCWTEQEVVGQSKTIERM